MIDTASDDQRRQESRLASFAFKLRFHETFRNPPSFLDNFLTLMLRPLEFWAFLLGACNPPIR